jgi:hypothetical protein
MEKEAFSYINIDILTFLHLGEFGDEFPFLGGIHIFSQR